jgi:hypothetical protein
MAFETRSGMPYNPYFDDPYFQLPFPPAAYRKGLADFADMKASDADRLRKAMLPNVPSSLDYFDDDPARMIQNQIQQYRDREPVDPPTRPQSVRPPSPEVQSRQMAGPPQQAQGPANPPRDTSPFNYKIPEAQTPPASQVQPVSAQGLLDTEEPSKGGSFYDDPMRMGLLQAGLGLMSAPRYSTNPNDVTLSSALARGLGGFVQGYGGTKKRLSEAERQKTEDEYKRSVRNFNQRYMQTQMDATQRRLDNEDETITQKVLRKQEAEKGKQAIIADILTAEPDATATRRSALNRMSLEELNAERAVYFPSAATLQQQEKERMARERMAELTGQPAETYEGQPLDKLNAEILKQSEPPKTETKPTEGQKLREDLERVFIYDPTTGERKIDEVYRNSPEYRKGIDQHLDSLQSSVSVGGVGTFEKPRYPLPDGIKWGVDLATPGRKVTDLGSFVQVEGLGDNQEKINSSFATLNKLQKLQNKLVEYGKPELAERLTKKDPKVRELVSDYYDLLLTLKEEYNLGVLTGNDEQIIKSVIADPTSVDLSNFFSGLDTFVASLNSVKKSVIDNLRPVASQYNIDIMDQYNAIPGYRPLTFDPIAVVPPDNDSAGYNSEAKSILQEIQTDVGPQEDPNMWNPLNWFNNN